MDHETADILAEGKKLIFSRRLRFLDEITRNVRGRLGVSVAWPDLVLFITPEDARRAYLAATAGHNGFPAPAP